MATLKRLIEGQNVRFDTHQAGDKQSVNIDGLHLEKILHNGGGKIRFPLRAEYEPNWSSRVNRDQYEDVRREVQRELRKNQELVNALAETVANELSRFSSGTATVEDSIRAARKLAGYFGLEEQFIRAVAEYMEGKLVSFSSFHVNEGAQYLQEVRMSAKRIEIRRSRRKNQR